MELERQASAYGELSPEMATLKESIRGICIKLDGILHNELNWNQPLHSHGDLLEKVEVLFKNGEDILTRIESILLKPKEQTSTHILASIGCQTKDDPSKAGTSRGESKLLSRLNMLLSSVACQTDGSSWDTTHEEDMEAAEQLSPESGEEQNESESPSESATEGSAEKANEVDGKDSDNPTLLHDHMYCTSSKENAELTGEEVPHTSSVPTSGSAAEINKSESTRPVQFPLPLATSLRQTRLRALAPRKPRSTDTEKNGSGKKSLREIKPKKIQSAVGGSLPVSGVIPAFLCIDLPQVVMNPGNAVSTSTRNVAVLAHPIANDGVHHCTIPTCGETFADQDALDQHVVAIHSGTGDYKCDLCGKGFSARRYLRVHLKTHTDNRPFRCQYCSRCFGYKTVLEKHIRVHTGERPFKCDTCGKSFKQKDHLRSHVRVHGIFMPSRRSRPDDEEAMIARPKRTREALTSVQPYQCDVCGRILSCRSSFLVHRRIHTGEKRHKCDHCGRAFIQKAQLDNHVRTHTGEKPFQCETCGRSFTSKGDLSIHRRFHSGNRPFQCDICGKSFIMKGHLNTHYRSHTGEKPFQCDTCGKAFTSSNSLKRHYMTHTGEKPHQCATCGRSFARRTHLKNHVRTHTGERPYNCDVCGRSFSQKADRDKHVRTHTEDMTVDIVYQCEICGKDFADNTTLQAHYEVHVAEETTTITAVE